MKKKLWAGVLSVVILGAGATAAFGATDTTKMGDIKDLYHQMFNIQKQIADKEVEAGMITSDQATSIKSSIDQRSQYHDQAIDNGQVLGPGAGMGMGMGGGMRGGRGLTTGQQPTQAQIDAWNQWHQQALENGTLTPGQGMGQGYGRRGGGMGGWGYQAPANSTSSATQPTN